ncbi:hypothetical protein [Mucilaginibacter pineti]|nr:hypothetical protein [Mucilaginibacter pineti]
MKKNYFLLFGSFLDSRQMAADLLYQKMDLNFVPHESSYLGEYLKYSGLFADHMTISDNFNKAENDWSEPEFKNYPVLIFVSHDHGRNEDKKSRHTYIKKALPALGSFVLLKAYFTTPD